MYETTNPLDLTRIVAETFSLEGRVAIVAGAGSIAEGIGIGRAVAIVLADAGAKVGLIDINADAASETLRMITDRGGEGAVAVADLTNDEQVGSAVATLSALLGAPSILVNNVGIVGPAGTAEEVDFTAWDFAMRVNVAAMAITAKHVLPSMRSLGGGSIVNISSVSGMGGGYPALFYPTSKGATISLTQSMAAHYGPDRIRVNTIAPGQLFTPRISARNVSPEMRSARAKASILGTEGTAWDAAFGVLYLASDASRWVTGIVLPVDAGLTGILPLQSPSA